MLSLFSINSFFFWFWLFVDLTFSDELDFIADLLWCEAKEEEAGLPLTEVEWIPDAFWLCTDFEWDAFAIRLEWYFKPYTFFLDSRRSI